MWRFLLCTLLLLPALAQAGDAVCGNGPRPAFAQSQGVTRYLLSVNETSVTDPTCMVIPKAETQAQRALLQAQTPPGSLKYLKVVNGLAVAMPQTAPDGIDKDHVDQAIAQQEALRQNYTDELNTNNACNTAALEVVTSRIATIHDNAQTAIDAITTLANAKTAMTQLNDAWANVTKQIARCVIALRAQGR